MSALELFLGFPVELACEILGKWLVLRDVVHLDSAFCHTSSRPIILESVFPASCLANTVLPRGKNFWRKRSDIEWIMKKGLRAEIVDLSCCTFSCLEYFRKLGHHIKSIHWYDDDPLGPKAVIHTVQHCMNLRVLDLTSRNITASMIEHFTECRQLESLSLINRWVNVNSVVIEKPTIRCFRLRSLRLWCEEEIETSVLNMCQSETLKTLKLSIFGSVLQLARFTNLQSLAFNEEPTHLNDDDDNVLLLPSIAQCPWILHLDLSDREYLNSAELELIAGSVNELHSLNIEYGQFINGLACLTQYQSKSLERLYIRDCINIHADDINNVLRNCPRLLTISFSHRDGLDYSLMSNVTTLITDLDSGDIVVCNEIQQHCSALQHLHVNVSTGSYSPYEATDVEVFFSNIITTAQTLSSLGCVYVTGLPWNRQDELLAASAAMPARVRVVKEEDGAYLSVFKLPF